MTFQYRRVVAKPGSWAWLCLCSAIIVSLLVAPEMVFATTPVQDSLTLFETKDYPPFLIGPGDNLDVFIYEEKDFPTKYMVESSGVIVVPLIGEVRVAGLTQAQAGTLIARRLRLGKFVKQPQVTVMVTESQNYDVAVLGAVTRPGKYSMLGRPGLLGILADAGGPTDRADLNHVVLIRGDRHIAMPLSRYLFNTDVVIPQPLLYPGDSIVVPQTVWPSLAEWGIIASIITTGVLVAEAIVNRP